MYYYLYDTFLNDHKYERVLDRIKTKLLDLDIQGKHERLSLLKNVEGLVNNEVKRGANTIIIIGNDKSFLKAVDIIAKNQVTLGIIPIGSPNNIAEILGIPTGEQSCEVLAARKIAQLDLGQISNFYFLSNIKATKNLDRLSISHQGYKVIPKVASSEVAIYNFYVPEEGLVDRKLDKVNPQDEKLDLVIKSEKAGAGFGKIFSKKIKINVNTIIKGTNFEIKSFEYLPLMIDGYKMIKTPVSVKIADKKLKVIIGKSKKIIIK